MANPGSGSREAPDAGRVTVAPEPGRVAASLAPFSRNDVRGMSTSHLQRLHATRTVQMSHSDANIRQGATSDLAKIHRELNSRGANPGIRATPPPLPARAAPPPPTVRSRPMNALERNRRAMVRDDAVGHVLQHAGNLIDRGASGLGGLFARARAGIGRLAGRVAGHIRNVVSNLNARPAPTRQAAPTRGTENVGGPFSRQRIGGRGTFQPQTFRARS